MINGETFRDILIAYSSEEEIETIEREIPYLNIYLTRTSFLKVYPEDLDVEDNETPVAVSQSAGAALYLNGEKEQTLGKGEVPGFHAFVVNQNKRVIIPDAYTNGLKSAGHKTIIFKSPNFDGNNYKDESSDLKSALVGPGSVESKAIEAAQYFNKDDGSIYSKAFQRDFIYYGITPQKQTGSLNRSVSEYISYIEVDPNAYFTIPNERNSPAGHNDPYIDNYEYERKRRPATEAELLEKMWTEGAYNFRFEVSTSTMSEAQVKLIPLRPDQLWDFNVDLQYTHSTWFRSSKYAYKIDPNKFISKPCFLEKMIDLGKWNIAEEALYRMVTVYEEDSGAEEEHTKTFEMIYAHKTNFSGDVKLNIGLKKAGSNVGGGGTAGVEDSVTEKVTKSITIRIKNSPNLLGKTKIFFYDPIIDRIVRFPQVYDMRTYHTGSLQFGITVK
ncbi:MAG: hypothetical protein JW855_00230 [Gammaproteobacteria bacterium]|nr:hypothetical protein [Gammaproteobacteria bacterium]